MSAPQSRRLGVIVPSSNTVAERHTLKVIGEDDACEAHFTRVRVVIVSPERRSLEQFAKEQFLGAAELLADAHVDQILWSGTSAAWLGWEHDRQIVSAIETHTGVPATTAMMAINARLARLRARKIALVTPYVEAIEDAIRRNYLELGVEIVSAARLNLIENTDYAEVSPAKLEVMVEEVARRGPDAIVISCTNLAGAAIARAMEAKLGLPVLDSVRVATEESIAFLRELTKV